MFLDVRVHHRPEVVVFTVPEQIYDEHLWERCRLWQTCEMHVSHKTDAEKTPSSQSDMFTLLTLLPVTGTPVVHIYPCYRPRWRIRCPGCLEETVAQAERQTNNIHYTQKQQVSYFMIKHDQTVTAWLHFESYQVCFQTIYNWSHLILTTTIQHNILWSYLK